MFNRRQFLEYAAATAGLAAAGFSAPAMAQQGLKFGSSAPFSFEALKARAQEMARRPYAPPPQPSPEVLYQIDYDAHGKIKFKTDLALWANGPSEFPVTFFHLGRYFQKPVRMHVVENGQAREIVYDDAYFDMPADSPAHRLPDNSGFAGFRFQEARNGSLDWRKNDWVAFLGASYFRAIGELYQYGLSARGLAVDVAVYGRNEEFPDFTHFYFDTPQPDSDTVTVYALLDGPSVSGAYRFVMRRTKAVLMDLESAVYLRQDVSRLGIAPLTSMYWYSEKSKPTAIDWRPEIHDSDGLAMWTGTGERIWRPLNNPPRIITSAFTEENPKGFGLLQRDRNFDHYLDGVYYDRRPSLWIEPLGGWGKGSIQLVEIPTDDEIHDNVVVMWVPAEPARAGQSFDLRYRMYWTADEPFPTPLARVVATRFGNGGQAGTARPKGVRKFMVEFKGEPLARLPNGVIPRPVLTASRGEFSNILTEAVPNDVPGHWRTQFDLTVTGTEPVEMRCYLRQGDEVLSETWLYQYHPPF
ncbi:glucan biosynthesis protein [Microvirga thermotolerans]|uniref:Glucan biosynthesis protein D n=1 Tax=Microvirga thermotolerans TaxID=2651334 RepID=A0A5P9JZN2_9HYPH|nr:glucan biosynthesis protein D [Microvirga thermotolerans]QFU15394.1 glucan biosynthesis protein D [Microvirga thermotolerans]